MFCCDVVNCGVVLYDSLVIFFMLDVQLIVFNQDIGKIVWKDKIEDYVVGYFMIVVLLIVKGMVLMGVLGGEFGVVGCVEVCDVKIGQLIWLCLIVEGYMGYKYDKDGNKIENGMMGMFNVSWFGEIWKIGGVLMWLGGMYDLQINLVYFGIGNLGLWNSYLCKGDNLYLLLMLVINLDIGKIVWYYQNILNDGWDFDGVNEFVMFDMDGKCVGGKVDCNGFFYVNDVKSGKLFNVFLFVKVNWVISIDFKIGCLNYVLDYWLGDLV